MSAPVGALVTGKLELDVSGETRQKKGAQTYLDP